MYRPLHVCRMWYAVRAMSASISRTTWTGRLAPPTPRGSEPRLPPAGTSWHLLSIREVAAACQLSEKAVRRAIDAGELPAVKLRSRLRVIPQDLAAWIASSRQSRRRGERDPRPHLGRRPPAGTFRALAQSESQRGFAL